MDEDPAFYKKFSQMLSDTIREYEEQRISETEYLNRVKELMEKVLNHQDNDIPEEIRENALAKAIYGVLVEFIKKHGEDPSALRGLILKSSIQFESVIRSNVIVDWTNKADIIGRIKIELSDIVFDEFKA